MSEDLENTNLTYEQKVSKLDDILSKLDNSEIPIDALADNVKEGALLIKSLSKKLNQVEIQIKDIFQEMESNDNINKT
jgi:exodeoxyribonuclease VII small subunit